MSEHRHGKGRHGGSERAGDEAARPGELTDFAADRLLDRFGPAGDLGLGRGAEGGASGRDAAGGIGRQRDRSRWGAEARDSVGSRVIRGHGGSAGNAGGAVGAGGADGGPRDAWLAEVGPSLGMGTAASGAGHADQAWRSRPGSGSGPGSPGDPRSGDRSPDAWPSDRGGSGGWPPEPVGVGAHRAPSYAGASGNAGGPGGVTGFGGGSEDEALARLLCAAAAPAHPHELVGYDSVRRAYEQAGARARGRHLAAMPLTRLAGMRLAALAGTLTVAGAAAAAEANALPAPIQRAAHTLLGPIGVPDPTERDGDQIPGGTGPGDQPHAGGPFPGGPDGTSTASGHASGNGTTSATAPGGVVVTDAVQDLCRAYAAGDGQGNTLTSDQRKRLAALAGGENLMGSYCAQVLATAVPQPSASPTSAPGTTGGSPTEDGQGNGTTTTNPGKGHVTHTTGPTPHGHTTGGSQVAVTKSSL